MAEYIVIFGAAVREDGSPSGSLRRRCENAVRHGEASGRAAPVSFYLGTGGIGRYGPAEALVIRDTLMQLGVPCDRIVVEGEARDTLESVLLCTRLLRERGDAQLLSVATSSYHLLRCTLLFRLAGFRCTGLPATSDRPHLGWPKWLRYVIKEGLALPWDAAMVLLHRVGRTI